MRLLLLTDKFAPHAGGTATVYRNWLDRLPPSAVRVSTCWFPNCREFDARCRYPIHRAPFIDVPKLRWPLAWAGIWRDAVRQCRRSRPTVIHAGQILETGLCALQIRRLWNVPYIVHCYGEELNCYARSRTARALMRCVLQRASAVTGCSRYTGECLVRLGLWDGPVARIYPGVEVARFTGGGGEAVRARHALGGAPVLLTVARLLARKGHDRVLATLPEIRRRVPGLRYLVVGGGPEEMRLRALAAAQDLSGAVVFAGVVSPEALPGYFAAADVFVHPNRELPSGDVEGFGTVFLEAGASGLPVVGGNSGGTPDAIENGVTGFLVDPNSEKEIVDRVTLLFQNAALRKRMGEAGRQWAAGFTWEAAAERVWEISRQAAGVERGPA